MKILDKESAQNIVMGATFFGAGGGGSPEDGLKLVDEIFAVTQGIKLVSPSEVPDNVHVAMVAAIGAPKVFKERGFDVEAVYAFEALERVYTMLGVKIPYLMAGEIGGFNTITPMYVAAHKGLPLVDCDGNGRAVPELSTTLYAIHEIPASPLVLADRGGNVVIGYPREPMDTVACENIARGFAVASGMAAAFAAWVVTGRQIRESLVLGSISECEKIGKSIKEALKKGKDPVAEVVGTTCAYELIRGTISDISVKTVSGFDFGRTIVEGSGPYAGKKITIDFKNENIIAWKEAGQPAAMVPDLICLMTTDGKVLTNADTQKSMEIAVIAVPANEKWKHPKGFEVWKHILEKMGYSDSYKPITKP